MVYLRRAHGMEPYLGVDDGTHLAAAAMASLQFSLLADVRGAIADIVSASIAIRFPGAPVWALIHGTADSEPIGVVVCTRLLPSQDAAGAARRLDQVCRIWQCCSRHRPSQTAKHADMAQSSQIMELEADVCAPFPLTVPVLLVAGLLALELMLFLAFATARITMFSYMGVHAGLCVAALAAGGRWAGRHSHGREAADRTAMVLQLVAWTGLAGPFGALTAVGLLVPRNVGANGRGRDSARGQAEMSRLELLHGSLLDRRLRLETAHSIRSLMDVIIDGTQFEKLDALSLISKSFVPALAPPLKRALEDKDAAVRVLAATVMAQQHTSRCDRSADSAPRPKPRQSCRLCGANRAKPIAIMPAADCWRRRAPGRS